MRKAYFGFFRAKISDGVTDHTRETYEMYYRDSIKLVSPETRLEHKMGGRW